MATYPTLTGTGHTPVVGEFTDQFAVTPAIVSTMSSGLLRSRARFTAVMPRRYRIVYTDITTSDKNLIRAFEIARAGGAEAFTMTLPGGIGTQTTVRFDGPVLYQAAEHTNYARWNVEFNVLAY